jgi:hypothetical protein
MDKIPRVIGILVSGGLMFASAANLTTTQRPSFGFHLAVWAGLILGNYCYVRLSTIFQPRIADDRVPCAV